MEHQKDNRVIWKDLEGFEKQKFERVQGCPNCPAMIQRSGASYGSEEIKNEWYCDECGVLVEQTFKESSLRWRQNVMDPVPVKPPEDSTGPRTLEAFERAKFEMTRGCPVCPGMLHDHIETHLKKAVQYTWECAQCGGRVTQRFDEARLVWEPAPEPSA